jgi:hypothetical protein
VHDNVMFALKILALQTIVQGMAEVPNFFTQG